MFGKKSEELSAHDRLTEEETDETIEFLKYNGARVIKAFSIIPLYEQKIVFLEDGTVDLFFLDGPSERPKSKEEKQEFYAPTKSNLRSQNES